MKKDENGPNHWAEIQTCQIDGVKFQKSPIVKYSAGLICEVKNQRWENLYDSTLHHMYIIYDDTLAEREWGMHKKSTDRYLLIKGRIEVVLFDGRDPKNTEPFVCELSGADEGDYSGLMIPPGVWHSFRNLDKNEIILMNFKFPEFNREDVDKYRLPMPNELTDFQWQSVGDNQ
jgi:dTDP-4-dehydrorhamnose 3,5-epimerase-like enzyme